MDFLEIRNILDSTKNDKRLQTIYSVTFAKNPWEDRGFVEYFVGKKCKDLIDLLINEFNKYTELSIYNNQIINNGKYGVQSSFEHLASWLIVESILSSSETAINLLKESLTRTYFDAYEILTFYGVSPKSDFILFKDIKLINVDQTENKDRNTFSFLREFVKRHSDKSEDSIPTILTRKVKLLPKTVSGFSLSEGSQLLEVAEILSVFCNRRIEFTGHTFLFEEYEPCAHVLSGIVTNPSEFIPTLSMSWLAGNVLIEDTEQESIRGFIRDYFSLSGDMKNVLRVSIHRLFRAHRELNLAQQAIELGIALEYLLTYKLQKTDPIAFNMRLRGAWYMGENREQRKEIYKLINTIYDYRSTAVHTGVLKNPKAMIKESDFIYLQLHNGKELCRKMIMKLVKDQKFPDWNSLILG